MNNLFKRMAKGLLAAGRVILRFSVESLRLLTSGAQESRTDNDLGNAVRGGDLNFQTGKFDDGTDPGGWYGRD